MESMLKSPSLFKSGSREILFHPTADQKETRAPSMRSFELQEDPSFWKEHNVQVVIRVRPLSSSEISVQGHNMCIRQDSGQTITWSGHPESRFTFDHVADENVSQEKLFKVAGVPMVENCVGGYNSCMFAYGQTGSGKTHTMLGDIEGGTRRHSENCGMTPRVFEHLFSRIQKEKESRREDKLRFTCRCSFLEIYNEQIIDLLDTTSNNLQIREDAKKGVYVENLKEVEVSCSRDVIQLLLQGATNRKVATTNMNLASSRSHSVFTCVIESKWECQGVMHHRFARLNLVDLAGSERQKSSGAEGERLKEATNINKSLSTLGLVIMNLVNISNGKSMHVPYRDSKLTFLLQDSLGGNSKTTIIANISPSSCCAQETLSTLKFAQRAKFIRNNAIVNEDASGDVITMRLQIQQLKKEVSHLQSLVNGASLNKESDNCSVSFPGSPGSFKWDTGMGSLSPLTSDKKFSQRKDEAALVGVLRREQEKDLAMKALAAEKEAALQLAKQREEEIQGLKMRLRLRESGIKRMEAVASGKMSAESHLLQEKNELLREIAILRGQVDRNQEVTRFAMENLQMKEEIRRLKSFYEEGEREIMSEQIQLLENKLLDALDWKLMYEKDLTEVEKDSLELGRLDEDNLLFSSQEPSSSWNSSINGEMEFLHLQAIQNQREVEVLRKNLNNCLEVKEKLERHVDELVNELEEERKSVKALKEASQFPQIDCPTTSRTDDSIIAAVDDQMELKTMVEAIAAASEREAEAHEIAIILAKENDELRSKDLELSHQLQDMNEEIENLRGYYEKAMQERDDLRRRLCSIKEANNAKVNEINCPEKLVEEDEDGVCSNEKGMMASKVCSEFVESQILAEKLVISGLTELDSIRMDEDQSIPVGQPINFVEASKEELNSARDKLDVAEDKLLHAAKAISFFGLLEKATADAYTISEELEATEINIQSKRREIETLKCLSSEMIERKAAANNKLSALKSVLPSFCSVDYWEQREAQAREKVHASSLVVKQKEAHFTDLQVRKKGISSALTNARQTEGTLRNSLDSVKSKLCEFEMRRKETEKVLFDRNQVDEPVPKSLHLGKAGDLLKSEEERSKLSAEKATLREKLVVVQKEISKLSWSYNTLETEIQGIDKEMHEASNSLKASQCGLDRVIEEKKVLMEMRTEGKSESEKLIVECVQCVFEADLKEGEVGICEDELEFDLRRLKELKERLSFINQKNNSLWEERPIAEKLVEEFGDVQRSIFEAKSSLFAITDR